MSTLAEIAALPGKSTQELNQLWRKLFETDPPQAGKDYLVRRLAYRVQELAHGGLSQAAITILDGLGGGTTMPERRPPKAEGTTPATGARLIREWQGMEHVVTVLNDGFEYQGRKFRSLSAVATRMDEAMEWLRWLDQEQVKLVWLRATRIPWKLIEVRFACDRSTAWRKWTVALNRIASRLEAKQEKVLQHQEARQPQQNLL